MALTQVQGGMVGPTGFANLSGITFPATQVPSSDANTLDDYEEGTWTPTLSANVTGPSVTYSAQYGIYTKIGRQVTVYGRIQLASKSGGSGSTYIGNLPFTAVSGYGNGGTLGYVSNMTFGAGNTTASLYINAADTTKLYFTVSGTAAGASEVPIANAASNLDVIFNCTYFV